jgi:DNA-binding transcriptional MerR regulator
MKLLDISDVVVRSGLPASALRYYEEPGLISSVGRRGLRRQFGPQVLQLTPWPH